MARLPFRRHALRWLAAFICSWIAPGLGQVAWAQTATVCHPADEKGTDGPIDFGAYCWIDFSPLNLTQAKSGSGQNFQVNLQGGAFLTFTLRIQPGNAAGNNMYAVPVPSWSGAAFGNSAFNDIPGNPILYQDTNNQNNPQDTVTLSAITLHANGSTELPFVFVAADGESSNEGEIVSFTTTGTAWTLVSAPGESNPARNMPDLTPYTTVGNSTGSQTVDIDGVVAGSGGGVGSYVFTTDNSPGTVTAGLEGNGLQGVLFGLKYHTIGLSLTKSHVGDFEVGGTGTYTINIANTVVSPEINPPSEPQPVRVIDTLPTGLTYAPGLTDGNGFWTCGAVGQVVTCDAISLQDLTTSTTFPPIILGVSVASDAPPLLTNNAEVSDPTTSTLVFNVCEVEDNGVCPSSATSVDGDETVIRRSDLSGSGTTKTVEDRNGGDAEANDVLRYTITVAESGGVAADGVSVVDDLAANLGSLSVVSIPPGSTDASNPTGGVNGTGRLEITGISVPANGSVSIVFDATISASAGEGDEIDNTATIANPSGTGGSAVAETVTVLESALPQPPGTKYLYLRNGDGFSTNLSRERPNSNGTYVTINGNDDEDTWDLTDPIPAGETLVLPTTVAGNILMRAGTGSTGSSRTVRAYLVIDRATGPDTALDSDVNGVSGTGVVAESYEFDLQARTLAQRTLNPGDVLELRIVNEVNQSNRNIRVYQRNGTTWDDDYSFLTFDTPTVINIDATSVHSEPASSGNGTKAAYVQGDHAYIRATVSDPFGTDDISDVSVVVKDPTGATIASGTMTPLTDTDTSDGSRAYEYDFTVPANPRLGGWTATVTAKEGMEDLVEDTANVGFTVHGRVVLGKVWGAGAINGNAVTLTITGGATQTVGSSTAGGSTTQATATSAAGVALALAEGFSSGTAGSYNISMACTRDKDSVALAATGTALSRTITMPNDSAVTCVWNNTLTVPLTVVKLSAAYSDPVNDTNNPKTIPGALVTYTISVTSPIETQVDADAIVVADTIPLKTMLYVDDLPDQGGSSPFIWVPGASGLSFNFGGLGADDDVEFSSDNGVSWDYEPLPDGDGVDGSVTNIRFNPKGSFAPGQSFQLGLRVKLE